MAIGSDLYTTAQERIVEILTGDERLSRDLPGAVEVVPAPPYEIPGPDSLVFVYRSRIGTEFWQGEEGLDVDVVFALGLMTRAIGDPGELERRMSRLAANVLAIVADHRAEAGYWIIRSVGPSTPFNVRRGEQHVAELEVLPVGLELNGVDL